MAEVHYFSKTVTKTESRANEEWLAAMQEREPRQPSENDWQWSVRDVTAGQDVASGYAETEQDADTAADAALHEARAAEKARLEQIVNPFALGSEEEIQAAYDALPV